jgi:hypothetical protein
MSAITFRRDRIGMVDWAFLPRPESEGGGPSVFALARFADNGRTALVREPFKPGGGAERWIPITNPKYDHAPTFAAFKRLAEAFVAESEEDE